MLKVFNCDLHVHTCLSPCAELDMHPMALVQRAIETKLDMIAICDHNSSANVPYVIKAAQTSKLKILPGMEITTSEEVHLLAIFDSLPNLTLLQSIIDQHLPGENDEDRFGVQAIVNENGEVELYMRFAGHKKIWDNLKLLRDEGKTISVKIADANKGGLMVKLDYVAGFLPVSQLIPEHYPRVPGGEKGKIL